MDNTKTVDVEATAVLLRDGIATQEEQGSALRAIKTGMAMKLSVGLNHVLTTLQNQSDLLKKAIDKHSEMMEIAMETDTVSREELMDYIDKTQNRQLQILELYRRTIQGQQLFEEGIMSEEERLVVNMFKSFKSPEDKQRFMRMCKEGGFFK